MEKEIYTVYIPQWKNVCKKGFITTVTEFFGKPAINYGNNFVCVENSGLKVGDLVKILTRNNKSINKI